MTFNPALIDAPIPIAIYGDPITDDEGHTYRPIEGYIHRQLKRCSHVKIFFGTN
jgi:hypothetical protein